MPRAFLITHRRYNTAPTAQVECGRRDSCSPERCVSVAEPDRRGVGQLPAPSDEPTELLTDASETSSECPEELYNLTQLAEVSLAAAAGHLFHHHHHHHGSHHHRGRFDYESYSKKYQYINGGTGVNHYERYRGDEADENEENRLSDEFEDHDGELKDGIVITGEVHGCPDCGKRYSTSSNLARHRQTHRSLGDKKARRCPHCDKVYVSMPAFSMHVRTHNQGCKCSHCGKCFSRPWLLQGHIRTHTGEKPFKCSICTKAFADKSNLRAHVQTHSNTKPHICGRCGKAFALKSYLYKHEESSCMRIHDTTPSPITSPASLVVPTLTQPTVIVQRRPIAAI